CHYVVVVTRFAWIGDRAASAACSTLACPCKKPETWLPMLPIPEIRAGALAPSVLQAALAALSPIQANLVTTTT
ncbi:hypothetical protein, partial [Mycobacterium asiaticum]|uniref:hypothetical protein n=1 Tax=Mycobacterium asiaticum TaxID=1790 RepID=UPI001E367359